MNNFYIKSTYFCYRNNPIQQDDIEIMEAKPKSIPKPQEIQQTKKEQKPKEEIKKDSKKKQTPSKSTTTKKSNVKSEVTNGGKAGRSSSILNQLSKPVVKSEPAASSVLGKRKTKSRPADKEENEEPEKKKPLNFFSPISESKELTKINFSTGSNSPNSAPKSRRLTRAASKDKESEDAILWNSDDEKSPEPIDFSESDESDVESDPPQKPSPRRSSPFDKFIKKPVNVDQMDISPKQEIGRKTTTKETTDNGYLGRYFLIII